jgi:DNA-binding MarR family transcriptional regulator
VDNHVSDEVRRLITRGITTVDEVDLLFYLASGPLTAPELATATRFDEALVARLVRELEEAGLVVTEEGRVRLTNSQRDRSAIDELLAIYNARPVTLVRAIYARELVRRSVIDSVAGRPATGS